MTLQEMSHTYRSQHAVLRQRIRELTAAGVGEDTRGRIRIRRLEEMAKENRDLAALLEPICSARFLLPLIVKPVEIHLGFLLPAESVRFRMM